ncbi:MAG TPA: FAD-binding oxidoreductase [Planctomycetota bacterium]|nr:FAD-binding oxidoreductase [Planctomycetota bacterium]
MPDISCEVAIIGGGIVGAAVAWSLAKADCRDVAVVEREINPGLGSTAKAAGGIRAQFGSDINIRLSQLSLDLFESFHRDVGIQVDFVQAGYLWIATRPAEMETFRKNVELQRSRGLDVKILDREGVKARAPYVRVDDVVGGTFHQRDGYAPPADYVMGYHKAGLALGVRYLLQTNVTGVTVANGAVTGLKTSRGEIQAKRVVCAAGAFSGQVGRMIGIEIPVQPVRRQVFVTEKIADLPHPIPMTVDFTTGVYCHSESGGVLVGLADRDEPPSFNQNVDYPFIEKMAELAMHRIPRLETATIKTQWAGLYEVTPDHHPILGAVPGLKNFYLATGFSGHGVMHAPATGKLMAELLTTGKTSIDIRPLRYERFREGDLVKETHVI